MSLLSDIQPTEYTGIRFHEKSQKIPFISVDFVMFEHTMGFFEKVVEKEDLITRHQIKIKEKTPRATIWGLFRGSDNNELPPKFGVMSVWGEACYMLNYMHNGGAYHTTCTLERHDNYYKINVNNFKELKDAEMQHLPDVKDLITEMFPPFEVAGVANNIGQFKLIHGRVKDFDTKLNSKGKKYGFIILQDMEDLTVKPIRINWFNAEFAVRYGIGSEVYILCDVQNSEKYGVNGIGHFIIPIKALPNKLIVYYY